MFRVKSFSNQDCLYLILAWSHFLSVEYIFPPPLRIVSNVKVQAWLALFDLKVGDWCSTRILYVLGAIRAQLSELN